ncbi:hypothetical protein Droror1_Dr00005601 [Drosera rotundifolia]
MNLARLPPLVASIASFPLPKQSNFNLPRSPSLDIFPHNSSSNSSSFSTSTLPSSLLSLSPDFIINDPKLVSGLAFPHKASAYETPFSSTRSTHLTPSFTSISISALPSSLLNPFPDLIVIESKTPQVNINYHRPKRTP